MPKQPLSNTDEERLRVSEQRLASILDSQNTFVRRVDPQLRLTYMNEAYARAFNVRIGDVVLTKVHTDDADRARTALGQLQHPPYRSAIDLRNWIGGEWRWVRWENSAIRDTRGMQVEIQGVGMDITELKLAEDATRQAHGQLRQLAKRLIHVREAEAGLLSRELHDEFGQMLTGLKMNLSWLESRLCEDRPDLTKKITSSLAQVDATMGIVRNFAARLRPRILDELGLMPAVEWLVEDFRGHTGIDAAVISNTRAQALGPEQATAVFRIVQESLSNIARHAGAKRIDVSLHAQDGALTLEVRDDGKGVRENDKTSYESIGLLGMRERALAAGGELTLQSVAGRGTIVVLRLPLEAEDA